MIIFAISAIFAYGIINFISSKENDWSKYIKDKKEAEIAAIEKNLSKLEDAFYIDKEINITLDKTLKFNKNVLNDSQKTRRLILLGDLYLAKSHSVKDKEYFSKEDYFYFATTFYDKALKHIKKIKDKKGLKRIRTKIARTYFEHKDWEKALEIYQKSESLELLFSDELWLTYLDEAECLYQLKRYAESIKMFDKIITLADVEYIWITAKLKKADILSEVTFDKEKTSILMKEFKGIKISNLIDFTDKLKKDALKIYNDIIKDSELESPYIPLAKKGILRIYISNKNRKAIYQIANKLGLNAMFGKEKLETLLMLAQFEKQEGNIKEAKDIYNLCLNKYAKPEFAYDIISNLYNIYKKEENWDKCFLLIQRAFIQYSDEKLVKRLIKDLLPHSDINLIKITMRSPYKIECQTRYSRMFNHIKKYRVPLWNSMQNEILFIKAEIHFFAKEYEKADKVLIKCMDNESYTKSFKDDIYYYYYLSSIEGQYSPISIIFRAEQYLDNFKKGKYCKEVQTLLLDKYMELKLYEPAIKIANEIFLREFSKASANQNNKRWANIAIKLAECYINKGLYDKADTILFAITQSQPSDKAFINWAKLAEKQGQVREAIRRFDLILNNKNKKDNNKNQYHILMARNLLLLQRKGCDAKDYFDVKKLLIKIKKDDNIPSNKRNLWQRQLYEHLLNFAYDRNIKAANYLTSDVIDEFGEENWTNYWLLRSFTSLFKASKLEELRGKFKRVIDDKRKVTKAKQDLTLNFLEDQLELINNIIDIDKKFKDLKKEIQL